MRVRSLWMQLEMGMSMRRYLPPMGTAGLDRSLVSGYSRLPRPPPRMMLRTFFMGRPRQGRRWRVSYHAFEGGKSNPRTALKPTRGPGWAFERYHLRPFAPAFPLVPCNR